MDLYHQIVLTKTAYESGGQEQEAKETETVLAETYLALEESEHAQELMAAAHEQLVREGLLSFVGDEEAEAQVSPWAAADAPGRVLLGKPHVRQPATLPGRQRGGQSPPRRGGEGGGDDGLILLGVYTARRVDDAHDSAEGESVA